MNIDARLKRIDDKVSKCNRCGCLVEKFINSETVHIGEYSDILLIGEAPANNGWCKSHKV